MSAVKKGTIEYNLSRVREPIEELDDMFIGPCYNDDNDEPVFPESSGRGDLAAVERADRRMRGNHSGDIEKFLEECPHLDPVRALELLSEFPLEEAISKGQEMVMAPKEYVPAWVEQQLGDPTDLKFIADNAFIDKMEEDMKKLGEMYEAPPILRIKEIENGRLAAEDPQKMETAYKKVEWPEVIVAARLRAARLLARQNKQKSTANKRDRSPDGQNSKENQAKRAKE
ncbi:hypothetical protein CAEBREN_06287 [Caenorhabditis brenneri]|uniref:Uncharacterized protein n=1 Tax=Caenorhabditis brenneri TaxID=135651 RepID=G0MW55_CAEBE|nr:hypothetical protein CAEBREN_06287 [Caenorhabditis brenneri]